MKKRELLKGTFLGTLLALFAPQTSLCKSFVEQSSSKSKSKTDPYDAVKEVWETILPEEAFDLVLDQGQEKVRVSCKRLALQNPLQENWLIFVETIWTKSYEDGSSFCKKEREIRHISTPSKRVCECIKPSETHDSKRVIESQWQSSTQYIVVRDMFFNNKPKADQHIYLRGPSVYANGPLTQEQTLSFRLLRDFTQAMC